MTMAAKVLNVRLRSDERVEEISRLVPRISPLEVVHRIVREDQQVLGRAFVNALFDIFECIFRAFTNAVLA